MCFLFEHELFAKVTHRLRIFRNNQKAGSEKIYFNINSIGVKFFRMTFVKSSSSFQLFV